MISRISFTNLQVRAQQRNANVNFRAQNDNHDLSKSSDKSKFTLDDLRKAENGTDGKLTDCAKTYCRFQDVEGLNKAYLNLNSSTFSQSHIKNSSFINCNLYNSYFINTKFIENVDVNGSSFVKCDFRRANFTGLENWENANFSGSWYDAETVFPEGFDPVEKGMKMPDPDKFMPSNK